MVFLGPTLFDNKKNRNLQRRNFWTSALCSESFNYEEAIELVNSHQFGNGAVIYT